MDWIISQATDTTKIPTGDKLFYIIQTTEIFDNKGNLYKKVDVSTLMKDKQIEEQESNSERGIVQKRRTHRNKRARQSKNGEEYKNVRTSFKKFMENLLDANNK